MNLIFTKIIDKADAATAAPDDYINPDDGLKYCGKCRIANEAFLSRRPSGTGLHQAPGYV